MTLKRVLARPPGGQFEDARDKVCASLNYMEQPDPTGGGRVRSASFSLGPKGGIGQDLSPVYPKGTLFDLEFASSGPSPLMVAGAFADPVARIGTDGLTLQAESTAVRFAFNQGAEGPDCSGPTATMDSFFGGGVMLEPDGGGEAVEALRSHRGAFFGTNAQNSGLPQVSRGGANVDLRLSGCGDGNPSTADGFFTGFLPASGAAEMGLGRSLLGSVPDAALDQIMRLADNGKESPRANFITAEARDLTLAPTPGATAPAAPAASRAPAGISIDYKLSFSTHRLSTTSKRRQLKLAKRCRARRGKLRVVKRGKGARAKKVLTCILKKRRR